ncbi:MAG: class I SAM-dependent methyltransferase [Candidatus Melainabacteria bacterium]|nr:class I SAM-dependent methyltransferase [Candidatus Melainabacteria bacterium]
MQENPKGAPDQTGAPDSTAVRVALWRALHAEVDPPPHVLVDDFGLQLVAPDPDWRQRPDMDPEFTKAFRAAIVARARFIEDLVTEQTSSGIDQYVILGSGLDTFAQRHSELASRLSIFEIDQPSHQSWKRQRLIELGLGIPDWLRLVSVDFEAGVSWWERLTAEGFDASRPAIVASTGVSMYLTKDATAETLRQVAGFAPGSTLAMTFLLPIDLIEPQDRPGLQLAEKGARASGTPFISFFSPSEILAMSREAGFREAHHVSGADLARRYFTDRTDGLRPSSGEDFLVASV